MSKYIPSWWKGTHSESKQVHDAKGIKLLGSWCQCWLFISCNQVYVTESKKYREGTSVYEGSGLALVGQCWAASAFWFSL